MRAQGQELMIRLVDELEVNISLVPDVIRETFSLSRVLFLQFLVAGEGLYHANISIQWQGSLYEYALIPGHEERKQWL